MTRARPGVKRQVPKLPKVRAITAEQRAEAMVRLTWKGDFGGTSDRDDGITILKDGQTIGSFEYVMDFATTDESACEMLRKEIATQLELHARDAVKADRRRIAKMVSGRIAVRQSDWITSADKAVIEELSTMALKVLKGRAR